MEVTVTYRDREKKSPVYLSNAISVGAQEGVAVIKLDRGTMMYPLSVILNIKIEKTETE